VTPDKNRIEHAGRAIIIRAVGAQVVERAEIGRIVHAAGGKAVRRHEATGSA
jgi:hypothetical protein